VHVGGAQTHSERNAGAVDHKMAFRPRFSAVDGVRADLAAPLFAGAREASTQARDPLTCPPYPSCARCGS
jgi:hypothetical protein